MKKSRSLYAAWKKGPSASPNYFPIAVWAQDPLDAAAYKKAGINLFVALHNGPTEQHLKLLKKAGVQTICHLNAVGYQHRNDKTIVGWMHSDEPDNAQSIVGAWAPTLKDRPVTVTVGDDRFGTHVTSTHPGRIISDYFRMKLIDPARPVYINLGCGVAYEKYEGRGLRSGHLEDYPEYLKGCDIPSYDIYPTNVNYPDVNGHLWYVPRGIDRLREWSGNKKPVWCWIECTRIGDNAHGKRKPTPAEVKAEIWMALIHGAAGYGFFCHSFTPPQDSRALLHDPEMLAAVTAINRQVTELAPVLNSPSVNNPVNVTSSSSDVPVDSMVKKHTTGIYVFAAAMRAGHTTATFTVKGTKQGSVTVLGEERTLTLEKGAFKDEFGPYQVRLYRIN